MMDTEATKLPMVHNKTPNVAATKLTINVQRGLSVLLTMFHSRTIRQVALLSLLLLLPARGSTNGNAGQSHVERVAQQSSQLVVPYPSDPDTCNFTKTKFDPFIHKSTYTIGVHATIGLDDAFDETHTILGKYLTATAGQKFDPAINFTVVPNYFDGIFAAIENEEMDFLYANPGVYSCIGTQVGATALATVIRELEVRGYSWDLDVYGGVIAVRVDNDEINTIHDLENKIIGAGAIIDLMGGQMQLYEMEKAGMSYVNDPKQMIFTKDQIDVVRGVLSGRFDVGFVRTNQIETTTDENGEPIDPNLFKILEPNIYVMDSGELFPFLHSTEIVPEWPVAALPSVPDDVQLAVQRALLDFGLYAQVGEVLRDCNETYSENYCSLLSPRDVIPNAPCDTTRELAALAAEAVQESSISGFRTARSYFELRSVQEEGGFLVQDDKGDWYCTRPTNLYEGITCPEGYFKRQEDEFLNGCAQVGLSCDDNVDYDCFCRPCVKAHEVDVYYHEDGEEDPHLVEYYGESLPGCEKMSICATVAQGETITLRIFDNMLRQNPKVTVVSHAGDKNIDLAVTRMDGTFAYEFSVSDKIVQVQVIDVMFDGKPISQSPIRVVVEATDCEAIYGAGSDRVPDADGNCICGGNTYDLGGNCIKSASFFLIIFAIVAVVVGILVFAFLGYKKKQSDSIWHINVDELHFNEPPEVIGQGGFGVVILGQYRGTKVAVKRVLPPATKVKSHSATLKSEESNGGSSAEITSIHSTESFGKKKPSRPKKENDRKNVKFGETTNSGDLEAQLGKGSASFEGKRTSLSGSTKDWERLITGYRSDNDILRVLEAATASGHGSDTLMNQSYNKSVSMKLMRLLPMPLRFDEHSRRINEFIVEMRLLSRLRHPCITTVMGAVISPTVDPMLVMEFMEYGSLHDLLHNETMTPGGEIILQIIRDIVQGVQFLHASRPPILHGDLKARNILVDSRFRAKVADFGFSHVKAAKNLDVLKGTPFYMAPEYLRRRTEYTTACDIYSFAMIIYEIYARATPFEGEDPRKVLPKVCHPRVNKRPPIPESCPPKMVDLMKKCWSANSFFRPSAKDIDYVLVEMNSQDTEPIESATEHIRESLKRKPTSLYDVFPKHVADALNAGKKVEAESHEIVTIVFSDIVGFTTISQKFTPMKVSNMLDRLYQKFDALADKHHVFKVETIGDAYMGVTNLDGSEFETHVKQIAEYAQDAVRAASQTLLDEDDPSMGCVQIRVGFNSGPVVSNVIGSLNPRYGLFGDTVNTASRMESNSMPGKIQCSLTSAQLLETQAPDIPITLRGMIKVKGKGKMKTYWVGDDDLMTPMAPNPMLLSPESISEHDPTLVEESERELEEQMITSQGPVHTDQPEGDMESGVLGNKEPMSTTDAIPTQMEKVSERDLHDEPPVELEAGVLSSKEPMLITEAIPNQMEDVSERDLDDWPPVELEAVSAAQTQEETRDVKEEAVEREESTKAASEQESLSIDQGPAPAAETKVEGQMECEEPTKEASEHESPPIDQKPSPAAETEGEGQKEDKAADHTPNESTDDDSDADASSDWEMLPVVPEDEPIYNGEQPSDIMEEEELGELHDHGGMILHDNDETMGEAHLAANDSHTQDEPSKEVEDSTIDDKRPSEEIVFCKESADESDGDRSADQSDDVTHDTHTTHSVSIGSSSDERDHFIGVHTTTSGSKRQMSAQVQMDGTVKVVKQQSNAEAAMELLANLMPF